VNVISAATEDEMVLAFLQAELESPVHGSRVRAAIGEAALITSPDLNDADENRARIRALSMTRGYARNIWLFRNLPTDIEWAHIQTTVAELARMKHMDYESFRQLTMGTLIVGDGASNIDAVTACDDLNRRVRLVEDAIISGETWPPLITIATGLDAAHRILEGNTRASASVLALPGNRIVPMIAGYSPRMREWHWYGRP
jgi:hypothetical protein